MSYYNKSYYTNNFKFSSSGWPRTSAYNSSSTSDLNRSASNSYSNLSNPYAPAQYISYYTSPASSPNAATIIIHKKIPSFPTRSSEFVEDVSSSSRHVPIKAHYDSASHDFKREEKIHSSSHSVSRNDSYAAATNKQSPPPKTTCYDSSSRDNKDFQPSASLDQHQHSSRSHSHSHNSRSYSHSSSQQHNEIHRDDSRCQSHSQSPTRLQHQLNVRINSGSDLDSSRNGSSRDLRDSSLTRTVVKISEPPAASSTASRNKESYDEFLRSPPAHGRLGASGGSGGSGYSRRSVENIFSNYNASTGLAPANQNNDHGDLSATAISNIQLNLTDDLTTQVDYSLNEVSLEIFFILKHMSECFLMYGIYLMKPEKFD